MTRMPMTQPRIALIHATPLAMAPVTDSLRRLWPMAQTQHVLDDSLSLDRARDGCLTDAMTRRFVELAEYAVRVGCEGILFTCSAFGPAIEAAAQATGVPTLKPNEAMFDQALSRATSGRVLRLGLVATFPTSINSMSDELDRLAQERGVPIELHTAVADGAMQDLAAGQKALHDRKVTQAVNLLPVCDVIMLAQFSMSAAQPQAQAVVSCPVLSSPDCAVEALRQRLATRVVP